MQETRRLKRIRRRAAAKKPDLAADRPRCGRKGPLNLPHRGDGFVRRGAMRSLPAGLARQSLVAAGMSAFVIAAAIAARPGHDQTFVAASDIVEKPILTTAIVTAAAQPQTIPIVAPEPEPASAAADPTLAAPQLTPMIKPSSPKKAARQACGAPCAKVAPTPHTRAASSATPVVVATIAPTSQADPPSPSLRKRLFAPVGFIRENVVRLIQWL
jgi:hypothetical protein